MPNFWTRAAQRFSEYMTGPRTKDEELQKMIVKMTNIEKGVLSLKDVIKKASSLLLPLSGLFDSFGDAIEKIYDEKCPFYNEGKDIQQAHLAMKQLLNNMIDSITILSSKTTEWSNLFNQCREKFKEREEKRKTYDHYEQKLEKIIKNDKQNKSKKEEEYLERNEAKYKTAAEEYVKSCEDTFTTIKDILERRFLLVNPVCVEFIKNEQTFINSSSDILKLFDNMDEMKQNEACDVTYDPWKSLEGKDLIKKFTFKRTREITFRNSKSKYGVIEEQVIPDFKRLTFPVPDNDTLTAFYTIKDDLNNED